MQGNQYDCGFFHIPRPGAKLLPNQAREQEKYYSEVRIQTDHIRKSADADSTTQFIKKVALRRRGILAKWRSVDSTGNTYLSCCTASSQETCESVDCDVEAHGKVHDNAYEMYVNETSHGVWRDGVFFDDPYDSRLAINPSPKVRQLRYAPPCAPPDVVNDPGQHLWKRMAATKLHWIMKRASLAETTNCTDSPWNLYHPQFRSLKAEREFVNHTIDTVETVETCEIKAICAASPTATEASAQKKRYQASMTDLYAGMRKVPATGARSIAEVVCALLDLAEV